MCLCIKFFVLKCAIILLFFLSGNSAFGQDNKVSVDTLIDAVKISKHKDPTISNVTYSSEPLISIEEKRTLENRIQNYKGTSSVNGNNEIVLSSNDKRVPFSSLQDLSINTLGYIIHHKRKFEKQINFEE